MTAYMRAWHVAKRFSRFDQAPAVARELAPLAAALGVMSVYVEVLVRLQRQRVRRRFLAASQPRTHPSYVRGMHYYSAALAHLHAGLSQGTRCPSHARPAIETHFSKTSVTDSTTSRTFVRPVGRHGAPLCHSPSSTARLAYAVSRTLSRDAMGPTHPLERASR